MKYTIKEASGFSFATITDSASKTLIAYISADIHDEQTPRSRATELIYTDALISGAGTYSREAFLDAVSSLGATVSASVSDGIFTLFLRADGATSKKLFSLFGTMMSEPHFNKIELKRIKQTVTNLINENKENTTAIAHEQLRNTIYGSQDRRYTFDDESLIKGVASVSEKDLRALHKKICATTWTCSLASAPENATLFEKSITSLKKRSSKGVSLAGIHQQKPPNPMMTLHNVPGKQNIDFSIGAPVPITLHHPDYVPLQFVLTVLGGQSLSSRLMSTVREKEGLTYGIYSRAETFWTEEQGYWRVTSFFSPEKSIQGLTSTFREIKKLYKDGISKEELSSYKIIYNTKQTLLSDGTQRQLNDLHGYHLQRFSLQEIAQHKNRIHTLTLDEVNTIIRHYLNPTNLTVSGAGPIAGVKKELLAFMKTMQ
jgi:zinc protease